MPPEPSDYLRPADLAPLRHLVFASRRSVVGHYAGKHASPQRGHSVEFQDYREYTPGDELNDVDWKVYGRSDKLFIKLFEHQSDMTVNLLVDASASMEYAGLDDGRRQRRRMGPQLISKFDHACRMAAAIAYLVTQQQDKVALGIAQHGLAQTLRAAGTYPHLHQLVTTMRDTRPRGLANLAAAIHGMARQAKRKGLLVVFSDLAEDRDAIITALSRFLHRGHEVIVFQVLHEHERVLPDLSEAVFVDSETGQQVRVNVEDVRHRYEQRMQQHLDDWRRVLTARGIDHNVVTTATPYHDALRQYLFSRASLM